MNYCYSITPVGSLLLARDDSGLRIISFPKERRPVRPRSDWKERPDAFRDVITQLNEYFTGRRQQFDLPLAPEGTPFQQRVWRALLDIPYGRTVSYGELAARVGQPEAARAVGLANGRNPLPVVIPCHRVIGANGTLTGYGGGLAIKKHLLTLEGGKSRLIA